MQIPPGAGSNSEATGTSPALTPFAELLLEFLKSQPNSPPAKTHGRGGQIYLEGRAGDSAYLLESGLVKVVKACRKGKEILLRLVPAGELFGDESVHGRATRTASAEAVMCSQVREIPGPMLRAFLEGRPQAWPLVCAALSRRLWESDRKIELLYLGDVEQRLRESLRDLSCQCGPEIPLTQKELATTVGATRETVSIALSALARKGIVRTRRGSTTLLKGFGKADERG